MRDDLPLSTLPDRVAIQLNDTHPALAVAEMMRLLVDEHRVAWDEAWRITRGTFSYTNHTLLPEAVETWPVPLMERLLPRHMQIIYRINAGHLDAVRAAHPHDDALLAAVSLTDEHHGRRVRMGNLAFIGSHRVNGVSALHTELMRGTVFRDLHRLHPDAHRQQDQRHLLPALAAAVQSGADAAAGRGHRRPRARRRRRCCPTCVTWPRMRASATASPPSSTPTSRPWRR